MGVNDVLKFWCLYSGLKLCCPLQCLELSKCGASKIPEYYNITRDQPKHKPIVVERVLRFL